MGGEFLEEQPVDLDPVVATPHEGDGDRHRQPELKGQLAHPADLVGVAQSGQGVLDGLAGVGALLASRPVGLEELVGVALIAIHQQQCGDGGHLESVSGPICKISV